MEYLDIQRILQDSKLKDFISWSLRDSLSKLGFSSGFLDGLIGNLDNLNIESFIFKHKDELSKIHLGHFFGELVPVFNEEYIVSEISKGGKVLDLGCGMGGLVRAIAERDENPEVIGVDISSSPQWAEISNDNIRFEVVAEGEIQDVLKRENPDVVTSTWVFHHMEYDEQERYSKYLFDSLKVDAVLILLEDSYAESISPEKGNKYCEKFMSLGKKEREMVMGVQDWIANRILSMRIDMPVPFAYRTLEDWSKLFEKVGFSINKLRFIGFPEDRDIHNPQSVLVLQK